MTHISDYSAVALQYVNPEQLHGDFSRAIAGAVEESFIPDSEPGATPVAECTQDFTPYDQLTLANGRMEFGHGARVKRYTADTYEVALVAAVNPLLSKLVVAHYIDDTVAAHALFSAPRGEAIIKTYRQGLRAEQNRVGFTREIGPVEKYHLLRAIRRPEFTVSALVRHLEPNHKERRMLHHQKLIRTVRGQA